MCVCVCVIGFSILALACRRVSATKTLPRPCPAHSFAVASWYWWIGASSGQVTLSSLACCGASCAPSTTRRATSFSSTRVSAYWYRSYAITRDAMEPPVLPATHAILYDQQIILGFDHVCAIFLHDSDARGSDGKRCRTNVKYGSTPCEISSRPTALSAPPCLTATKHTTKGFPDCSIFMCLSQVQGWQRRWWWSLERELPTLPSESRFAC